MAEKWTYKVKAIRFFVDAKPKPGDKPGKKKRNMVVQRMLYLTVTDQKPDFLPDKYRVFVMRRSGVPLYSLSSVPKIPQSIWENPSGKPEAWYAEPKGHWEEQEQEGGGSKQVYVFPWKKDGKTLTEEEFMTWLRVRFKDKADKVFLDLVTWPAVSPGDADSEADLLRAA